MKTVYLAGGCFWGTQKFFDQAPLAVELLPRLKRRHVRSLID